jgi:lipoic acid synthetase
MSDQKPEWLKVRYHRNDKFEEIEAMLDTLSLHTVCEQASCPNRMECYGRSTATFMILGRICTRNCTFCDVAKGEAQPVDRDEPLHVAQAIRMLKLKHAVITSVTRDDLPDGGAGHFAEMIRKIRELNGNKTVIEVLIPDFKGSLESLSLVVQAKPEIINHNVETVPRLYPEVRPMADYRRSLKLLGNVKILNPDIRTKSGFMLGLGETEPEIIDVMRDLREVDCDFLTIGQYLRPSKMHHPVVGYIHPDVFETYRKLALEMGFRSVSSSPFTRSSYNADKVFENG